MMKSAYAIKGMKCEGCLARVSATLAGFEGITIESITLDPPRAILISDRQYRLEEVNARLSSVGRYTLHNGAAAHWFAFQNSFKRFLPLIVLFFLVCLWTFGYLFLRGFRVYGFHGALGQFMGAYFLLFGALKAINWKNFIIAYRRYDDLAKKSKAYAYAYPAIEISLGIVFATATQLLIANIVTAIVMSQKAYSVWKKLRAGDEVNCACLGGFFSIPVTKVTLAEDLLMAVMALVMLFQLHFGLD